MDKNTCVGCGKKLSRYNTKTQRCKSCWAKKRFKNPENHPNYKQGIFLKPNYCSCGKKISYRSKRCNSCAIKGKRNAMYGIQKFGKENPCYRGGLTSLDKLIRTSQKYLNWRTKVLQRDKHTCQECGKKEKHLEVHHVKEFSLIFENFIKKHDTLSTEKDKEKLLKLAFLDKSFWNLEYGKTLCEKCHNKTKRRKNG